MIKGHRTGIRDINFLNFLKGFSVLDYRYVQQFSYLSSDNPKVTSVQLLHDLYLLFKGKSQVTTATMSSPLATATGADSAMGQDEASMKFTGENSK